MSKRLRLKMLEYDARSPFQLLGLPGGVTHKLLRAVSCGRNSRCRGKVYSGFHVICTGFRSFPFSCSFHYWVVHPALKRLAFSSLHHSGLCNMHACLRRGLPFLHVRFACMR